jgi:transketolase
MAFTQTKADDVAIATIRTLAADTVSKANSGHPGQSPILIVVIVVSHHGNRSTDGHGASCTCTLL